jgi:hypothetical protein
MLETIARLSEGQWRALPAAGVWSVSKEARRSANRRPPHDH